MMLRTKPTRQNLWALLFTSACLTLVFVYQARAQTETSVSAGAGFKATIEGAYQGEASGAGVLVLLPDAGFSKQGYFFLSDGRGLRPHGLTFILPRDISPGHHKLTSPSPLEIGTVASVRVDRDTGVAVIASDRNTSGFLDLTAFPTNEDKLTGSDVAGRFEFETEDAQGRKIEVTGALSFKAK